MVVTTPSEAGAKYRHFDAMPLGLGVIREGLMVYANAALLRLLGLGEDQVVGKPFQQLGEIASWEGALLDRYTRRMRGELVPMEYELSLHTATGEQRVEVSVSVEGSDAVVLVRDVSARAHHRSLLQRLAEVGAVLPGLRTEREVLNRVFSALAELGFTSGYLVPEGQRVRLERVCLGPTLASLAPERARVEGRSGVWSPLLEQAWKEGAAYEAELVQELSRFATLEGTHQAQTLLSQAQLHVIGVRIEVGGQRQAVLVVAADWLREDSLPPLRLFGAQVSAALEAALTISQLSAQNTALAALNRLAATAATAMEPAAFFKPCAQEITRLLHNDALGIFLRVEDSQEVELVYSHGLDKEMVDQYRRPPLQNSLSGRAMQLGKPQVVDAESCPSPTRENMLRLGLATVVVLPLRVRAHAVGTLVVAFRRLRRLTALERETLQAMGAHLAAATESHRLLTEVRRRANDLILIHEVGRNMVATLEMDVLLRVGVEGLALIARAPNALLLLLDEQEQHLEIRATALQPTPPEVRSISLPISDPEHSLSVAALHSRMPILVEDARADPRVHPELGRLLNVRAALVLPLIVRERAVGVAFILESEGPRVFTPSEVERASAITYQLALALEQARLIEDLRKRNEELKRTQEQLVQRERLAALGELSAVVAHEVRNPLGAIFNSVATIRRMIGPASPALQLVNIVGEEAERLNRIVDDLLHFSRPPSPNPVPVPLSRLLEDSVRGALADSRGGVKVDWALEAQVPPVLADERMMRQAFLNLALNAVQAMPDGGTLRVGARRVDGSSSELQVEFTDTGSGISPEVRKRIFEPFFTTKAKGTGLGLALVKRIIEAHAGRLTIESQPGQGTTFRLFLPCESEGTQPLINTDH
ncbi:ATP-binding protein [Hyalangium rubrum]|uniref:histidine kinase n=1 Tax=Hyalangium rubrum TaxID=3103134 RepID=A0ABU5GY99_9BACT|nr:GAF domain-containing protein [Hyalangium sp. s54d21]MDY7226158.1 GAF domain-containing protein [Hyalangium sp. s54d21]